MSKNGSSLGPIFVFGIDRCSVFYMLDKQRFPTLGLCLLFSLYRIAVNSV